MMAKVVTVIGAVLVALCTPLIVGFLRGNAAGEGNEGCVGALIVALNAAGVGLFVGGLLAVCR